MKRLKGSRFMMLFREKQQIIIFVIAGSMIAGFVLFRYRPFRKRIKVLQHTKATQTLAVAKASEQVNQLPELKEQLLRLQKAVENYEENIPAERALGEFLHTIAELMNEHNLKEQVITPGEEMKAKLLIAIPVNMQCKGGLKQIFDFYKSLQELDRLVRIEQVTLKNDHNFSGEVNMQTKAVIYYRDKAT
ncbi:MAG: type IV pilus inner membrane component PilO [Planctomycetota bacterium]|jgi:Tfp pilus assembly protein PilO